MSPFERSGWRVPSEVEPADDRVIWRPTAFDRRGQPTLDRLSFVLGRAYDAAGVARLMRLMGLLGICEHDRPFRHSLVDGTSRCWPTSGHDGGYETVAGWRYVSESADQVLDLAAGAYERPDDAAVAERLTAAVDAWMVMGEVRPEVGTGRAVALTGSGLLGDLAVQLLTRSWVSRRSRHVQAADRSSQLVDAARLVSARSARTAVAA